MKFPYKKLSALTIRYYWVIILATIFLTGLATYKISDLQFRGDFIDLLPKEFESVNGLNEIKKRVGGEGYLVIVLETDNIEQAKLFTEALVPKLLAFSEINYIDYKFDKQFFEDRNLLYIDKEDLVLLKDRLRQKIESERNKMNPFFIDFLEEHFEFNVTDIRDKYSKADIKDYYITDDPKRLVMLIKPGGFASDLEFCRRLLAKTQATVASLHPEAYDKDMKVIYTGRYVTRIEETEFMFADLSRTSVVAIVGVLLLLMIFIRQFVAIFFIGIPLITSIIYTLALTTITIGYLNLVTSVLVAILAGMGIDFGIHLYWRYLEERQRHRTVNHSVEIIQSLTGKPVILAGLTTAVAFFVLIPTKFVGFSQFGFIAGSGVIISLFNTFFLLPALLVAHERVKPLKAKMAVVPKTTEFVTDFIANPLKYPKPKTTIAFFSVFVLFSLWALTQLEFDYDFRKLNADKNGTLAIQEEISDAFGVSLSPTLVYVDRLEDIPKVTENVNKMRDRNPNTTIQEAQSLYTFVPKDQEAKIADIRELGRIADDKILRFLDGEDAKNISDLKRWARVQPFGIEDLPEHLYQQFSPVNGYDGSFMFIFPSIDLWHGSEVIRFAKEIRAFRSENEKYNIQVASESLIFSDILSLVQNEGPIFLFASLLAVILFLWLDVRSLRIAFLVISPLCTAIISLAGCMYLFGIKLNFMNAVIFPILLGLGIDHGVHIYHRYKEAGPGSLRFVLRKTGSAIILSTATTMIGFGALLTAIHRGLNSIGLLAIIGLALTLLTSMTLLPAILQVMEDRKQKVLEPLQEALFPSKKTA